MCSSLLKSLVFTIYYLRTEFTKTTKHACRYIYTSMNSTMVKVATKVPDYRNLVAYSFANVCTWSYIVYIRVEKEVDSLGVNVQC